MTKNDYLTRKKKNEYQPKESIAPTRCLTTKMKLKSKSLVLYLTLDEKMPFQEKGNISEEWDETCMFSWVTLEITDGSPRSYLWVILQLTGKALTKITTVLHYLCALYKLTGL